MTSRTPAALPERLLPPLALLFGALVFLPVLGNSFWADDYGWVSRAMAMLHHPEQWLAPTKSDYRPLASLSFLLNLRLSGIDPAGYYAFNLVLHLAVAALVMALARRLTGSRLAAGLAGLLFAAGVGHYGEAITWICGRTGPLADLCSLAALLFHWEALERGRARDRALSVACFALALSARESAVMLPVLLLLLEWARGATLRELLAPRRLATYLPYAVLLAADLIYEFGILRAGSPILQSEYVVGPHAAAHFAEYLVRMFLPVIPSSILVPVSPALRAPLQALFAVLMVGVPLLWLVVWLRSGASRAVRFGVLWMAITLLPYVFFTFRTSTRYLYTPAIGLALVLAVAGERALRSPSAMRRRAALVALALLLIAQAAVIQVIIRRHGAEQRAQSPTLDRDLRDQARSLGIR